MMFVLLLVFVLSYYLGKYLRFIYLLNIGPVSFTLITFGFIISFCRFVYSIYLFNNGYEPVYKECIWSHPNYEDCIDYFAKK
jgi:hypothetical protein